MSMTIAEATSAANPQVYFDVGIGATSLRLVFELFANVVPKTAENFRCLCTGETKVNDTQLAFKGSKFHRIIAGFMAQGGDFTHGNGTGGMSIYGSRFEDENFSLRHEMRGVLSMANAGRNTNGSQFFICFRGTPHLNGKHVVFGRVVDGLEAGLKRLEAVRTDAGDRPRVDVVVRDCGELLGADKVELPAVAESPEGQGEVMEVAVSKQGSATSGGGRKSNKVRPEDFGLPAQFGRKRAKKNKQRPAPTPASDAPHPLTDQIQRAAKRRRPMLPGDGASTAAASSSGSKSSSTKPMTAAQKRLFELRMRMNQSRKLNNKAAVEEHRRQTDTGYEAREKRKEWESRAAAKKAAMAGAPAVEGKRRSAKSAADLLHEPAQLALRKHDKAVTKERNKANSFGWGVFNSDSMQRAYDRKLAALPRGATATAEAKDALDYGTGDKVSQVGLDRLKKFVQAEEDKRSKFSRRRTFVEGEAVDYINPRNRHFNKKIARFFDKYSTEIKQNLERGTAL